MRFLTAAAAVLCLSTAAHAQQVPCGGSFSGFVADMKREAAQMGYAQGVIDGFFAGVSQSQGVLNADRAQGFFQSGFVDFSRKLISQYRLDRGRQNAQTYDAIFDGIESRYGVPRGVLLSFWAFETDYGGFQGDFNTINALVTLSHDCRRPELFRPQVFAALELFRHGDLDRNTTGAWAGEIGMVQMLPGDIIEHGVDADGDGIVTLKTSIPDALYSGASLLRSFGWQPNQPWMEEVAMPANFPWEQTGLRTTRTAAEWGRMGVQPRSGSFAAPNLRASIIVPQGHRGPAFLVYPNFSTLFEWNQSFVYVTTAAYFATRLQGAPVYNPGNPTPALGQEQMKALQRRLQAMGYDVGGIDGILGANTRAAVQQEQERLGLPADAWPTQELLNRL
ncbi:MAG: lytic murein transglycosylase [Paracoccaceae bacterium]